ncbi:MAG: N-acetyl-gamma-glutamyl-phosphate reductase [Actinobacteria bacterium]|nr:N-acetyl-gamma-glutamyl-phosphate reductase [Actinomycetota bacterium]
MGSRAVVLGASGFAGAEVLRFLSSHPGIDVVAAGAASRVGIPLADFYPSMPSYAGMVFSSFDDALGLEPDIVFSSLPHTHSMELFGDYQAKVVDLAGDFRLKDAAAYPVWYGEAHRHPQALDDWTYGLTEIHRNEIRDCSKVANPGCYAAAALLALAPIAEAALIEPSSIHIDAKSGVSGAGRAGGEGFDFVSANENSRPYSVTGHKHIAEIEQELTYLAGSQITVSFIPHLVPMNRGILATCIAQLRQPLSSTDLEDLYHTRYGQEHFITVLGHSSLPETKRVSGSNFAEIAARIDDRTSRVIAMCAIDNLGKGAAGQAIQNANLMLGLPENTALDVAGMVT